LRHALHKGVEHAEIALPLVQPVAVVGIVQHPAMHADAAWRDAQEIAGGGIEIERRAGESHLVRKELLRRRPAVRHPERVSHRMPF
jgi:hypothetical protein